MQCNDIREMISEYIDGVLDADSTALLENHLAECEACRAELDETRAAVALLREVPDVEPPADLLDRIHSEIGTGEQELAKPKAWNEGMVERDKDASSNIIWAVFSGPQARAAIAALLLLAVGLFSYRELKNSPVSTKSPVFKDEEPIEQEQQKEMEMAEEPISAPVDDLQDAAPMVSIKEDAVRDEARNVPAPASAPRRALQSKKLEKEKPLLKDRADKTEDKTMADDGPMAEKAPLPVKPVKSEKKIVKLSAKPYSATRETVKQVETKQSGERKRLETVHKKLMPKDQKQDTAEDVKADMEVSMLRAMPDTPQRSRKDTDTSPRSLADADKSRRNGMEAEGAIWSQPEYSRAKKSEKSKFRTPGAGVMTAPALDTAENEVAADAVEEMDIVGGKKVNVEPADKIGFALSKAKAPSVMKSKGAALPDHVEISVVTGDPDRTAKFIREADAAPAMNKEVLEQEKAGEETVLEIAVPRNNYSRFIADLEKEGKVRFGDQGRQKKAVRAAAETSDYERGSASGAIASDLVYLRITIRKK